jgi:hypothetical protein
MSPIAANRRQAARAALLPRGAADAHQLLLARGRRIVFAKTRQQERREVARAKRATAQCIAQGHIEEA